MFFQCLSFVYFFVHLFFSFLPFSFRPSFISLFLQSFRFVVPHALAWAKGPVQVCLSVAFLATMEPEVQFLEPTVAQQWKLGSQRKNDLRSLLDDIFAQHLPGITLVQEWPTAEQ
jgi:hypothetical protein